MTTSRRKDAEDRRDEEWTVVEQRLYEPRNEADLTTVVIEAVAAAEGVDVTDILEPPLYAVVDITAVKEALFGARATNSREIPGGTLDFDYRNHRITVRGDGWVRVADRVDG